VSCDREFTRAGAGFDQAGWMAVAACAAPTGGWRGDAAGGSGRRVLSIPTVGAARAATANLRGPARVSIRRVGWRSRLTPLLHGLTRPCNGWIRSRGSIDTDWRSCASCDREFTQAGAAFDQAGWMAVAACAAPTGGWRGYAAGGSGRGVLPMPTV